MSTCGLGFRNEIVEIHYVKLAMRVWEDGVGFEQVWEENGTIYSAGIIGIKIQGQKVIYC